MELKDLVGMHILDAVDFDTAQIEIYRHLEDCQVCNFRLDGVVYSAVEDPDDGYRSTMKDLIVNVNNSMRNVFLPVKVIGFHVIRGEYGEESDLIEFRSIDNGEPILIVGTTNTNDYYPVYISRFSPENMPINKDR